MKRTFIITHDNYKGYLKKIPKHFKAKSAYQFPLLIPFYIPTISNTYMILTIDDYCFITKFDQIEFEETTDEDLSDLLPVWKSKKIKRTYIEVLILLQKETKDEPDHEEFNDYFGKTLYWLNHFLSTLLIKTKNLQIKHITHKHFPYGLIYEYFNPANWNDREKMVTILNTNTEDSEKVISVQEWNKLVNDSFNQNFSLFPFTLSEKLAFKSLYYFREGLFQDCIIFIQTSIESLVKIYFLNYAYENNIDDIKIERILSKYKNLIEHHAPKFLQGDWQIKEKNILLYTYWNTTYKLRNKIVHFGYIPNIHEANAAIRAGLDFKKFITKNVKTIGKINELINGYYTQENYCYASDRFYNDTTFANQVEMKNYLSIINSEISNTSANN